jgi:hypothetical protein
MAKRHREVRASKTLLFEVGAVCMSMICSLVEEGGRKALYPFEHENQFILSNYYERPQRLTARLVIAAKL